MEPDNMKESSSSIKETATTENPATPLGETSSENSPIKYLYTENRALRQRVEALEQREEQRDRKLSKMEEVFGKVNQIFSNFFRPKGLNISAENKPLSKETTESGYLSERPAMDMEQYKAQLEAQGLSPQEIVQRISRFDGATPFEGGYNLDAENQSKAPDHEISEEEYLSYRPTFDDYRKEKIEEAGGVTREVAQDVNAMRERTDQSAARVERKEQEANVHSGLGQIQQKLSQTFRPSGTNLDKQNQISDNKDELTVGESIDRVATDKESAHAMVNLAYGNNNNQTSSGDNSNSQENQ